LPATFYLRHTPIHNKDQTDVVLFLNIISAEAGSNGRLIFDFFPGLALA
jgi:hypothetical protein